MWAKGHVLQAGKYQIQTKLGQRGFELTYLARDLYLSQYVVIKTPDTELKADPEYSEFVRCFQHKGQVLSKISHPSMVKCHEYFEEARILCLVVAYVNGETLNERIQNKGRLSPEIAVECFQKLGRALDTLHQNGLIHCDIHPDNIILQPNSEPIIIDIGSAKLLQPTTLAATTTVKNNFIPYEQEDKKNTPQPTLDIYGLAATLYFAVTGQIPQASMSRKLFGDRLPSPKQLCGDIEDWLNISILNGMALEADARPASMQAWINSLHPPQTTNQPELAPSTSFKQLENHTDDHLHALSNHQPLKWILGVIGLGLAAALGVIVKQLNAPVDTMTTVADSGADVSATSVSHLKTVLNRGTLHCGIDGDIPGFSFVDERGTYSGLDVDICKAVAAALFDDPNEVEYHHLNAIERFKSLQDRDIDMLSRNTTWTTSRDTVVDMEFAPTTFFDGQGMMVRADSGIETLEDMAGLSICVKTGTTNELNLIDQFRQRGIEFNPIVFQNADAAYTAYDEGYCEGYTTDKSQLIGRRSTLRNPEEHILLNVTMSKEPLGPLTMNNDSDWFDTVKWITYGLIQAEEFGLTSENIEAAISSNDPKILRFVGAQGELGNAMGLSNDFMLRAIKHVGNYGEIFDRNLGKDSPFQLERGQNALWTEGGLMYSPPWR